MPQWTLQAVALLKNQYEEVERRERKGEGEGRMGTSRGGCTTERLHEHSGDNV